MTRINATQYAQSQYGDPTAWRNSPTKILTSSHLAGVSLQALKQKENAAREISIFNEGEASQFFSNVRESLNQIINLIDNDTLEEDTKILEQGLFDLEPTLELFSQSLVSSRSFLQQNTYDEAIKQLNDLRSLVNAAKNNNASNIRNAVNVVFSQIEEIADINGEAGRKIANNVMNLFLGDIQKSRENTIQSIGSIIATFLPEGSIGQELLNNAAPIISAAQSLLETAKDTFDNFTLEARGNLTEKLNPILDSISNVTRLLPGEIANEINEFTQDIVGFTSRIDNGLSAIDLSGRQLQPLAGRFGANAGTAVSTRAPRVNNTPQANPNLFNVDSALASFDFASGRMGIYGNGVNSVLPSVYIQNAQESGRVQESVTRIIKSSNKVVVPEVSNIKYAVVEAYRSMPSLALRNPELANGPSLTNVELAPVTLNIEADLTRGTTISDLFPVVESSQQIFVPRL